MENKQVSIEIELAYGDDGSINSLVIKSNIKDTTQLANVLADIVNNMQEEYHESN